MNDEDFVAPRDVEIAAALVRIKGVQSALRNTGHLDTAELLTPAIMVLSDLLGPKHMEVRDE